MPCRPHEADYIHISPLHPPILEKNGMFFYPDGCQISEERAKQLLDYVPHLCQRWGIPVNRRKQVLSEGLAEWERKRIIDRLTGRFFDADLVR